MVVNFPKCRTSKLNPNIGTTSINELRPGPLAIISDIHGNLDALAVVLKDVAANCCRAMICLGDIIGYGPEPGECVRLVREYANNTVTGNHEAMFLAMLAEGPRQREKSNDLWRSLALCRKDLTPDDRKWIRRLPLSLIIDDISFVHASLHQPVEFDYIYNPEFARQNFAAQKTFLSFHGHTHIPAIWEKKSGKITGYTPSESSLQLDPSCRYAVCVGSVGQPRNNDPRAAYAFYEPETHRLTIRRLPYDIERASERFAHKNLLGFHALRIRTGE